MKECIEIYPVANGFIVYLSVKSKSPRVEFLGGLNGVLKQIAEDKDPVLQRAEEQLNEGQNNDLSNFSVKNCHVFFTFPEVLAFLKMTYAA